MAQLTSSQRNHLPSNEFAIPGERRFPIPDKPHAIAAKRLMGKAKGLTEEDRKTIIQMANAKLQGK